MNRQPKYTNGCVQHFLANKNNANKTDQMITKCYVFDLTAVTLIVEYAACPLISKFVQLKGKIYQNICNSSMTYNVW